MFLLLGPILSKFSSSSARLSMCVIPCPMIAYFISSLKCLASFWIISLGDITGRSSFASAYKRIAYSVLEPVFPSWWRRTSVSSSAQVELTRSKTYGRICSNLEWPHLLLFAISLLLVQIASALSGSICRCL